MSYPLLPFHTVHGMKHIYTLQHAKTDSSWKLLYCPGAQPIICDDWRVVWMDRDARRLKGEVINVYLQLILIVVQQKTALQHLSKQLSQ